MCKVSMTILMYIYFSATYIFSVYIFFLKISCELKVVLFAYCLMITDRLLPKVVG